MQKGLKAFVAATLAVPPVVMTGAIEADAATVFKDVPTTQTHYDTIMKLYNEKVISGYEDGTFRPNQQVTRGQAAKILAGVLGLDETNNTYNDIAPHFSDVPKTNSYYPYIEALVQAGIISGFEDGTFRPNSTLTRGQMSKIIYNGFNLDKFPDVALPFNDVSQDHQYYHFIKSLFALGVTIGKTPTAYGMSDRVTRGQLASFVIRARHVEDTATVAKVQSIDGDRITLNIGTYEIGTSLKSILNDQNKTALLGADITLYASKNMIVGIQQIELNARGTQRNPIVFDGGNQLFQGDLVVNSEYATVRNMTVAGNVLVNGLNSGGTRTEKMVTFRNVDATTTEIADNYAYVNSTNVSNAKGTVYMNTVNANMGIVKVAREEVSLTTDTAFGRVEVAEAIEALDIFGEVTTLEIASKKFKVGGNGVVTTLNYRQKGLLTLTLSGRVGNLNMTKEDGLVHIGERTEIDRLAKLSRIPLEDVIVNVDDAQQRIAEVVEYGMENSSVTSLEALLVTSLRTDRTYLQGEALDLTEFIVTGVYADGSTKRQRITASSITGYNPHVTGKQTLTFTIDGVRTQLAVNVVPLTSLKVIQNPTKTIYRVGDAFNASGLLIEGTYANGAVKTETITTSQLSGYNLANQGTQTVTASLYGKTTNFPIRVLAKDAPVLQKIALTQLPTKQKYYQGEALNLSGLTVTGTYADGRTQTETITPAHITGYNALRGGKQTLTVNINGLKASFNVDVVAMDALVVKNLPTKREYRVGEQLQLSGLQVIGRYADGTERVESVDSRHVTGFNSARTGTQTVRVTVNGRATSFDVKVMSVTGISVSKLPNKVEYFPGEPLELAGFQIQAEYSDQTVQNFDGSYATVTGYNPNLWGDQVLTVTYDGFTTQFKIRVLPLRALSVETSPAKTTYAQGDALDLTGLKVIGTYDGGITREEQVTMSMISNFDSSLHNSEQNVMVTINGITTTFKVRILQAPLAMSSLVITRQPDRIRYRVGMPFSSNGMIITALNNDGTTATIALDDPSLQISQIDTATAGEKTLTVKYGVFEATMPIDVYDAELTGIAASTIKTAYVKGEELDLNMVTVLAAYNDGTEELSQGDYEISGYDKNTIGAQTVTVTFNGKTATFTVNVADNAIRSFTVEPQTIFVPQYTDIDVTKLTLVATMDNAEGEQRRIQGSVGAVAVEGYDKTTLGTYPVRVTYGGKTANATVRVVSANTIVSVDKVELWWNKNGVDEKYPYSVVSKQDTDTSNVYFRVMEATNGAGRTVTDRAVLDTIRINTVNIANAETGQPNTVAVQVNGQTNRLQIQQPAKLQVALRYIVDGIPLDTPVMYPLTTVTTRQITSVARTSGEAVATTTSAGVTATAKTITFNTLDQSGDLFTNAVAGGLYYTLTKSGATENATALAIRDYANGQGKIETSIQEAGTYTVRIYNAANRQTKLGEFTVAAKRIVMPTAATDYDYTIDFATPKTTLDVANYAWHNDYTVMPTVTDSLQIATKAFVDGVQVDLPQNVTVRLRSNAGMTYANGVVTANAAVKPVTNYVGVYVGNTEIAVSPAIELVNTLPKYDLLSTTESIDIFKYFTAQDQSLRLKLQQNATLTAAENTRLQALVLEALLDVSTIDVNRQAIRQIDVNPTPIESSPDGSKKRVAVNVTIRDMFTPEGTNKILSLTGEYVDVWMKEASVAVSGAEATAANVTISTADLVQPAATASEVALVETTGGVRRTLYKGTYTNTNDTTNILDAKYTSYNALVSQLTQAVGTTMNITQIGNKIRVNLIAGSGSLNGTTYQLEVNGSSAFQLNEFAAAGEVDIARVMAEGREASTLQIDGTDFVYNPNTASPEFQDITSQRVEYATVDALTTLINRVGGTAPFVTAAYTGGDIVLTTTGKGVAGSQESISSASVFVNGLEVAEQTVEDVTYQYRNPWIVGNDAVYVGDLKLTFSQAVQIPLTQEGVAAMPMTIAYSANGTTDTIELTPAMVQQHVTVNGSTVTISLDALGEHKHVFTAANTTVKITEVEGVEAAKGFYTSQVQGVYQDVTIQRQ